MLRPQVSHIGLWVWDVEAMLAFYRDALGLIETDRGRAGPDGAEAIFLSADPSEHHQVVLAAGRPAEERYSVVNHLSFKVETLSDLREIAERIGPLLSEGPFTMTHGNAWSIYGRDPEGNMLEFHCDSPWYVVQPFVRPFDLAMSDAEIEATTLEMLRNEPGFRTNDEWRQGMTAKLAANAGGSEQ